MNAEELLPLLGCYKKHIDICGTPKEFWIAPLQPGGEEEDARAICLVDEITDKTPDYIMKVIQANSFNAGCRWQRKESAKNLMRDVETSMKKLVKGLKRDAGV